MRAVRAFAAFAAGMLCATGVAWSQAYPNKPVRVKGEVCSFRMIAKTAFAGGM